MNEIGQEETAIPPVVIQNESAYWQSIRVQQPDSNMIEMRGGVLTPQSRKSNFKKQVSACFQCICYKGRRQMHSPHALSLTLSSCWCDSKWHHIETLEPQKMTVDVFKKINDSSQPPISKQETCGAKKPHSVVINLLSVYENRTFSLCSRKSNDFIVQH